VNDTEAVAIKGNHSDWQEHDGIDFSLVHCCFIDILKTTIPHSTYFVLSSCRETQVLFGGETVDGSLMQFVSVSQYLVASDDFSV